MINLTESEIRIGSPFRDRMHKLAAEQVAAGYPEDMAVIIYQYGASGGGADSNRTFVERVFFLFRTLGRNSPPPSP